MAGFSRLISANALRLLPMKLFRHTDPAVRRGNASALLALCRKAGLHGVAVPADAVDVDAAQTNSADVPADAAPADGADVPVPAAASPKARVLIAWALSRRGVALSRLGFGSQGALEQAMALHVGAVGADDAGALSADVLATHRLASCVATVKCARVLARQGVVDHVPRLGNWRACQAFALRHGLFCRGATKWLCDGDDVVDCGGEDGAEEGSAPKRARVDAGRLF